MKGETQQVYRYQALASIGNSGLGVVREERLTAHVLAVRSCCSSCILAVEHCLKVALERRKFRR